MMQGLWISDISGHNEWRIQVALRAHASIIHQLAAGGGHCRGSNLCIAER